MSTLLTNRKTEFGEVAGWFPVTDQYVFNWILNWQSENEPSGDLVELGVFEGKSAIFLGDHVTPGERLTVCDLFETIVNESTVSQHLREGYANLNQEKFEQNYKKFHASLPSIVKGLSNTIVSHVSPSCCRFIHIDASHQYEHVKEDAQSARVLLRENGVVVFDDYRTQHTAGTAAAVWEEVSIGGLKPICLTAQKFYGTWGDPEPLKAVVRARAAKTTNYKTSMVNMPHNQAAVRVFWVK